MKFFLRFLSYLLTALAACVLTLGMVVYRLPVPKETKLSQLEQLIDAYFIGEYDPAKTEDAAAAAMILSLGDRWSYYMNADDFAAHMEQADNAYVGIGITITENEDGTGFRIIGVQANGSAKEAGIMAGDIIVQAGGQSTEGMDTPALRSIVRGPEGTSVKLTILRNGETLEFEVVRTQILTEVVTQQMLDGNIGLITIANFDARCAKDSIAAIEALREHGASALIFDVRGNPGGFAQELVELLDYLLPEGELFRTEDYAGTQSVDRSDPSFLDLPMAVLCNGSSYSAAEFFAAAMQEYEAAVVVGTPTCGKGYFQYTFQLSDGSGVGLSVGKYYTPKGISLIGTGVQPDILVEVDDETQTAILYGTLEPADDPQIQAAVAALTQQP